ncbi:zinc finger protein 3-like [Curcuma longa]|uniref:zinc finger protein 3-like n=1 Tax=Curcuma longa TaxID=136217 RepID=UPI003D9F1C41
MDRRDQSRVRFVMDPQVQAAAMLVMDPWQHPDKLYSCKYSNKMLSTPQGLGGHQNAHKTERQQAKLAPNRKPEPSACYVLVPLEPQDGSKTKRLNVNEGGNGCSAGRSITKDFISNIGQTNHVVIDQQEFPDHDLDLTLRL